MGLPKAVKQAAEQADELARQTADRLKQERETPPTADDFVAAVDHGDEPQEGRADPEDATPPDTDAHPERDTQDSWKQKYDALADEHAVLQQQHATLRGKFNSQVPRLQTQVGELQEKVEQLQGQLQAAQQEPPADDEAVNRHLEKMRQDYSEDLVDDVAELTREIVRTARPAPQGQQLETEINALREQVKELNEVRVDDQLNALVPGWQKIQNTPEFQKLLGSSVPRTNGRLIYDDLLKQWYQDKDVPAIVQFFNEFLNERQQATQQQNGPAQEAHVEPDSDTGSPAPTPAPHKKVWTVDEVERFNRLVQQGHFKKREDEAERIRVEIEQAAADGRVVRKRA